MGSDPQSYLQNQHEIQRIEIAQELRAEGWLSRAEAEQMAKAQVAAHHANLRQSLLLLFERENYTQEEVRAAFDACPVDDSALREHDTLLKRFEELVEKASRFVSFFAMVEAHLECSERPPLDDFAVIAAFMGSGASDNLTARDFRELAMAIKEVKK